MRCPNCKQVLSDNIDFKLNFCPLCGKRLYDSSKNYLLYIHSIGQSDTDTGHLLVFVDEKLMYEVRPDNGLLLRLSSGFHTIKFRHKIRDKKIQILMDSDFDIKVYYNSITSLIETTVTEVEGTEDGSSAKRISDSELSVPVMISENGEKGFDVALGDDEPDYTLKATSGLCEGVLKIFTERLEFMPNGGMKKDTVNFKNVISVSRKMGSLDLQCDGNVHKIYSIPKESYNEVLAFLTNRIGEVSGR